MNGKFLFNQIIARQQMQERLRRAERSRLAMATRPPAAGREAEPRRRRRRWPGLPRIEFFWQRPRADRLGG
jgi:hypothetical protein